MKDVITVELDLPDTILTKLVHEADECGMSVDELVEVIIIDRLDESL